jgi:mannose-6-phosphate isomerase-like protein (cupin superfamily)
MRLLKLTLGLVLAIAAGLSFVSAQEAQSQPQGPAAAPAPQGRGEGRGAGRGGRGAGPLNQLVWAPKAAKPGGWTAPHKPHTKLPDVLAKHKGQTDWTETIVDDETLHAEYISMGPGKKTARRMNADTREWWWIQEGQVRFTIDGQEPFVASKANLVQVPYRTMYTMETVGNQPSLRFEVNIARATKMYAMDEKPAPLAGREFLPVRVTGRGTYEGGNKPLVDFNAVVAGTEPIRQFVVDPRGFANIIIGRGIPPPELSNKGHFHEESSEFWLILLGQIRYNIEGLPVFVADQGDVVYVPKQRWHLASFAGDSMSCRLAMNGYPDLAHSYETETK